MRSSSSNSSASPASHHLPTTTESLPSIHNLPSTALSSQHVTVTSHYEHLPCMETDWLPSDADAVAWATVTKSGAYLTLPHSGIIV